MNKLLKMNKLLYDMLWQQAMAERGQAILTLHLLSDHPAGIGDHSTSDFYDNANEALEALTSADDRIATLEKYYKESKVQGI